MTINEAVQRLIELREKHGDVQVLADCPFCGRSFACGVVVAAPVTVQLKEQ